MEVGACSTLIPTACGAERSDGTTDTHEITTAAAALEPDIGPPRLDGQVFSRLLNDSARLRNTTASLDHIECRLVGCVNCAFQEAHQDFSQRIALAQRIVRSSALHRISITSPEPPGFCDPANRGCAASGVTGRFGPSVDPAIQVSSSRPEAAAKANIMSRRSLP